MSGIVSDICSRPAELFLQFINNKRNIYLVKFFWMHNLETFRKFIIVSWVIDPVTNRFVIIHLKELYK